MEDFFRGIVLCECGEGFLRYSFMRREEATKRGPKFSDFPMYKEAGFYTLQIQSDDAIYDLMA